MNFFIKDAYIRSQKNIFGRSLKRMCIFMCVSTIVGGVTGFVYGVCTGFSWQKVYQMNARELSLFTFKTGVEEGIDGSIIGFFSIITIPALIVNVILGK